MSDVLTQWYQKQVFDQCPWRKRAVLRNERREKIINTLVRWQLKMEQTELVINTARQWNKNTRTKHPFQEDAVLVGMIEGTTSHTYYRIWMTPKQEPVRDSIDLVNNIAEDKEVTHENFSGM